MRIMMMVLLVVFLAGCIGPDRLEEGLSALYGQNKSVAINIFGYPDSEQKIAGDTVYVWKNRNISDVRNVEPAMTVGKIGDTEFHSHTQVVTSSKVEEECTIKIATDDNGVIKHTEHYGDFSACWRYRSRLVQYMGF